MTFLPLHTYLNNNNNNNNILFVIFLLYYKFLNNNSLIDKFIFPDLTYILMSYSLLLFCVCIFRYSILNNVFYLIIICFVTHSRFHRYRYGLIVLRGKIETINLLQTYLLVITIITYYIVW